MPKTTALHARHLDLDARIAPFGGWSMPLHYGSQLEEHDQVRRHAGMFDVSYMAVVDIYGLQARDYLRRLLANDVAKLQVPGKALYSCMLNEKGGVLDDLIVYYFDEQDFRVVLNAATTEKDLAWMLAEGAAFDVDIVARDDQNILAVQGPKARELAGSVLPDSLRAAAAEMPPFYAVKTEDCMVARTGYTGEDGYEIILPYPEVTELWDALLERGVKPCGWGARDTLRLEAGMNLYGLDMTEETSPLESGLGWTVCFSRDSRDFIGRAALEKQQKSDNLAQFVGLILEGQGMLRAHQDLFGGNRRVGEITSGGFSPTLQRSIALARIEPDIDGKLSVAIRGKRLPVRLVKPPFVRHGDARILI